LKAAAKARKARGWGKVKEFSGSGKVMAAESPTMSVKQEKKEKKEKKGKKGKNENEEEMFQRVLCLT